MGKQEFSDQEQGDSRADQCGDENQNTTLLLFDDADQPGDKRCDAGTEARQHRKGQGGPVGDIRQNGLPSRHGLVEGI